MILGAGDQVPGQFCGFLCSYLFLSNCLGEQSFIIWNLGKQRGKQKVLRVLFLGELSLRSHSPGVGSHEKHLVGQDPNLPYVFIQGDLCFDEQLFLMLFLLIRENINTSRKYPRNIPKLGFGTHSSESEWLVRASNIRPRGQSPPRRRLLPGPICPGGNCVLGEQC